MTPRLKEIYSKEIQPALKDSLGLKNIYMAPKIEKIVLNMGLGLDGADGKILKAAEEDMGKNSVIPCRIPRIIACRILMSERLRHTFVWIYSNTALMTFIVQVDTCSTTYTTSSPHSCDWLAFRYHVSWFHV